MIVHRILAGKYTRDRLNRAEALQLAKMVQPIARKHCKQIQLAGSYRRGQPSIGDLDFVVTDGNLGTLLQALTEKLGATKAPRAGQFILTVLIPFGRKKIQVEFVNVKNKAFGSGLLHSTGSGEFNVGLRSFAKGKGLILNQHGLWHGTEWIAGKLEEGVFRQLGLKYIPPEERNVPFAMLKDAYLVDPDKNNFAPKKPDPSKGKVWTIKSRSSDNVYYVTNPSPNVWKCTCPHNRFRHVDCDHIKQVQQKVKR